ncbi:MAG: transporter substrate-binding domain-containing protein [Dictyoglomus sp.]|nr:transporter substrate-binding domain-containing protein [Dictyoglomus sp.]MDW8187979.1 transporter substrate-binding domain-containing protein [Dictyoglomus sp.]
MRKIIIIFLNILIISFLFGETNKDYIHIAGDYKFPPFEYLDEDGNARGFSVDIINELSKELKKNVVIELIPWEQAISKLRKKEVDGVALMRITEERKKEFDFVPYFENFSVIVVLKDSPIQNFMDLRGKKISCLNLDVAHSFLLKVGEVFPKTSSEEVLRSVLNKEVSAGVVNYYVARWIINKNDWHDKLKILSDKLFTNYAGIALPKDSPYLDEIQRGISKIIKSPVYNNLILKWFGEEVILKEEVRRKEIFSQILIYISLFILLLLLGVFISRRYLKKEIYRQILYIRSLYNFLKDTFSKEIEEIEEIYFEKIKEIFPKCKIKYFKKTNGDYLLLKSYPEEKSYSLNLESLTEIPGEKYFFKDTKKVFSCVVIEGETEKYKEVFQILSKEFETLLLNLESERKLKQSEEFSKLLDSFSSIYRDKSLNLEDFLNRIIKCLQGDAGSIMIYFEEEKVLKIKASVGLPEEVVEKTVLKLGEGIAGWVAENKVPLILEDVYKDKRFKIIEPRINIKSSISYPLIHEGELIGVLNINSFKEYRKFTEENLLIIEKIAPLLALALYKEELRNKIKILDREALFILVEAIDARDPYTGGHSRGVRDFSMELGRKIGLDEEDLKKLEYASYLHDVGKIKVPDFILRKPGRLTEEEYNVIKLHTIWGEDIVKNFSVFKGISSIIRYHHERWDGKGYPDGLIEEEIPLFSRIIALSDSFQAMTSFRPYRKKLTLEEAIEEIKINRGKQFDPYLSDIFIETILEKMKKSLIL